MTRTFRALLACSVFAVVSVGCGDPNDTKTKVPEPGKESKVVKDGKKNIAIDKLD